MSCPICLQGYKNPAKLDGCFHTFCWICILEWAKQSMTCPLCKCHFSSLIHNIKPDTLEYERVFLPDEATVDRYSNLEEPPTTKRDSKRRAVYQHSLVPIVTWTQRNLPYPVRTNEPKPPVAKRTAVTERLTKWVQREIPMLFPNVGLSKQDIDNLLEIVETLIQATLENEGPKRLQSDEGYKELRPFLEQYTEKFVSELLCFLTSPFATPYNYDVNVTYTSPDQPERKWNFGPLKPPTMDVVDLTETQTNTNIEVKRRFDERYQPDSYILLDDSDDEILSPSSSHSYPDSDFEESHRERRQRYDESRRGEKKARADVEPIEID